MSVVQIPKKSSVGGNSKSGGASKSGASKKSDGSSASAKPQAEAVEDVEVDFGFRDLCEGLQHREAALLMYCVIAVILSKLNIHTSRSELHWTLLL